MLARNASSAETIRNAMANIAIRSGVGSRGTRFALTVPRQSAANSTSAWFDKSFGQSHRFRVGERAVDLGERVGASPYRMPRNFRMMALEKTQRANEVSHLAAPAAPNLQMLAVDLLVNVDRARPGIGVMTGDHIAAAVADEGRRFLDGARRSGGLDGHVDAHAARQLEN